MSTSNFSSYLKSQKADFLADNGKGWTVVMGNEAGDLDSLASALGYAWLRSNTSGKAIAFITTPREDFTLRAENLYALGLAGINQPFEELYCSGDLNPMPSQVSQFALVDHNVLHTSYASPTARVVAVIDHHEDEGRYKDTADPRIVEPVGSCSSLVARLYQSSSNLSIPPELSTLLLSSIMIDTRGLKQGGKALDVDREAAAFLIPHYLLAHDEEVFTSSDNQLITHHPPVHSLSTTLEEKKLSVSHLNMRDLLRRDYKEYAFTTPASDDAAHSVPLRLSALFASSNHPIQEIQDWLAERHLSILGVLTTFRNKTGKGRREQLWIVKAGDEAIAEKLWQGLKASKELELKRLDFSKFVGHADTAEESEDEDTEEVTTDETQFGASYVARAYKQGNANATRKQTAPILRRLMEGV